MNLFWIGFVSCYALFDFVDFVPGKEDADNMIRGKCILAMKRKMLCNLQTSDQRFLVSYRQPSM